jgi:ADP-ribose pyrophosphatase
MPDRDAHLRWTELSRRLVASCGIFDLIAAERVSPAGLTGQFWVLDARDWVNVVPVLHHPGQEPSFLMVRQYRHGAERITMEFPAGLVESGEAPAAAAARELLEETGYRAGRLTPISEVRPNPAFMNNRCHTFVAEDLQRNAAPALDELEALDCLEVPVTAVVEGAGHGEIVNALTVLALMCYREYRARRP